MKAKVKTLPVDASAAAGKGGLYQDARSHLKRVVTRQISKSGDADVARDDDDGLTPIDRLIRQGSFEPAIKSPDIEKGNTGRYLS
jgi:hypothetical protein